MADTELHVGLSQLFQKNSIPDFYIIFPIIQAHLTYYSLITKNYSGIFGAGLATCMHASTKHIKIHYVVVIFGTKFVQQWFLEALLYPSSTVESHFTYLNPHPSIIFMSILWAVNLYYLTIQVNWYYLNSITFALMIQVISYAVHWKSCVICVDIFTWLSCEIELGLL